ncbi:hypothetical protein DID88_002661 [Monilinia fructigena]|uniref:Uncharacterized protein n=1 Tax=Monilinia fructigena TaxID=38457 RepID=A0A395IPG5_9HELO|nr:hypothetical protein DID88_002661 [Monilinia fructigena]
MQIDANSGSHEMRIPNTRSGQISQTWKRSTEQWLEVDWQTNDQEVDESEPFWNSSDVDPADTHSSWGEGGASPDEDGQSDEDSSSYLGGSSTGKGNVPTLFNELGELMGSDYTDSDADSDVGSEDSFYTAAPWNDFKEVLLQFRSFQEAGQRQTRGLLGV